MSRVSSRIGFIEPQLPSPVDQPPEGKHWIHEIKHDGYRCQVLLERGQARVFTRNGHDWSDRYPSIVRAGANLGCQSVIIDGEVIVQDARGVSDFESLKFAIRWQPQRLIFYAFDLLQLNGKDLRNSPLLERRGELKKLIGKHQNSPLQFSEEFTGDAAAFFRACAEHRLEGVVSKLASSPYRSGRSKTWLKCKCFAESTFVIIGTARDRKTGAPLALLARANGQRLAYAGSAFITLSGNERKEFWTRLENLTVRQCPLARLRMPNVEWVRPEIVARVRHLAGAKYLRHRTVRGFTN